MHNSPFKSSLVYTHSKRSAKSKNGAKTVENGIGYYRPSTISPQDFKQMYAEWETKLKDSGFKDIEYRLPDNSGRFSSLFRHTSFDIRQYTPEMEDYYRLCRAFLHEFNFKKHFKGEVRLYKHLWYLHSEGTPYRVIVRALQSEPHKLLQGVKLPPPSILRSTNVFWVHGRIAKVLDLFWEWVRTQQGYALTEDRPGKKMPFKSRHRYWNLKPK